MKYRKFIENNFLIDEPKQGKLVPFKFNKVQVRYYDELCRDYDIENKGLITPIRDEILKARREGFSSVILALFAADDITSDNPTETFVVSYKDDATKVFSKRYKLFITSAFEKEYGIIDSKQIFEVDNGNELILRHNKARFHCGTASARTAARGGVLQKLLFSEAAHYPDAEKITAREIIDGTMRQVDINSGWIFIESTANGYGNYYEQIWSNAVKGESRFKPRFYGWEEFYTKEEFDIIASEFADKDMLKQEYPRTPEEAFIASGSPYFNTETILEYIKKAPEPRWTGILDEKEGSIDIIKVIDGPLKVWKKPEPYHSYTIGGDVAEGIEGGDYSPLACIDNESLETVAKYKARIRPDQFAEVANMLGKWYNNAYLGIEANFDGLWVNTELFEKFNYPNLYYREAIDDITRRVGRKIGFQTSERTRRPILDELQKMLHKHPDIWTNVDFLNECLVFIRNSRGRPEAMAGKNDDEIFATAIAYEIRRNAPEKFEQPHEVPQTGTEYVKMRLRNAYGDPKPKEEIAFDLEGLK